MCCWEGAGLRAEPGQELQYSRGGSPTALTTVEPTDYQAFDYNASAWTYQLGASYKVIDSVSLYANKSTAFNPQPQIDSSTGLALPNNTSSGD